MLYGACAIVIALNYFFQPDDLDNRIFSDERRDDKARFMQALRAAVRRRGEDMVTLDTVDLRDPGVRHVLYFDYSWRMALHDPWLRQVSRDRRALAMIEPSNVNPSLYYMGGLRGRFKLVFTYDLALLRRHPEYVAIHVPAGADMLHYRDHPLPRPSFADRQLLVAVNANRWSYMPQSTYRMRLALFRYFERAVGEGFDLYGRDWNRAVGPFQRIFGLRHLTCYRGEIQSEEEKLRIMGRYRFALCVENNATQAGYVSEKMLDCLCARCVPVYHGWRGAQDLVPRDAWIDLREFRSWKALVRFLRSMTAVQHQRYVDAGERFLRSPAAARLTTQNFLDTIANRLCRAPGEREVQ